MQTSQHIRNRSASSKNTFLQRYLCNSHQCPATNQTTSLNSPPVSLLSCYISSSGNLELWNLQTGTAGRQWVVRGSQAILGPSTSAHNTWEQGDPALQVKFLQSPFSQLENWAHPTGFTEMLGLRWVLSIKHLTHTIIMLYAVYILYKKGF